LRFNHFMKNFKRFFFAALIASFAFLNSCKDSGDVGYSVLPASDTLRQSYAEYGFADGDGLFKITNVLDDDVRTDSCSYSLIGVDQSSTFGTTKAAALFSLLPYTSSDTTFRLNEAVDSLVLILGYKSYTDSTYYRAKQRFYGNYQSTRIQAFLLSKGSAPYSIMNKIKAKDEPKYDPTVLGEASLVASENETQVRLKFTDANRDKFAPILIRNTNPLSYQDFWNEFPGLYVKASSTSGNIHIFNVATDSLKLYTRRIIPRANKVDSILPHVRVFRWDPDRCLNANLYKHDYTSSKVNFSETPSQTDTMYYLQGAAGVKAKLTLGDVKKKLNIKNNDSVYVSKATIKIKVDGSLNPSSGLNFYSAFPYIRVYLANDDGILYEIPNLVTKTLRSDNISIAYGYTSFAMNTKGYYEIDVTAPVHSMIRGTPIVSQGKKLIGLNSFYITTAYNAFTAGRLILSKKNTSLQIIYSKVATSSK